MEPGFETGYAPADIERGRAVRQKLGFDVMVMDVRAAVDELRRTGLRVGVVGYCMGGTMAWLAATRIDGVAAAVGYYGGGIADTAAEPPRCPVLLHFGETDASIPAEHWAGSGRRTRRCRSTSTPAGHGFSCDERGSFHEPSHGWPASGPSASSPRCSSRGGGHSRALRRATATSSARSGSTTTGT